MYYIYKEYNNTHIIYWESEENSTRTFFSRIWKERRIRLMEIPASNGGCIISFFIHTFAYETVRLFYFIFYFISRSVVSNRQTAKENESVFGIINEILNAITATVCLILSVRFFHDSIWMTFLCDPNSNSFDLFSFNFRATYFLQQR